MTVLYFVRHAQPDYRQGVNSTFVLSEEGMNDRMRAAEVLEGVRFDRAVSSPYTRSVLTIMPIVESKGLELTFDERLRERDNQGGNTRDMFRRRWADFDFHEEGARALAQLRKEMWQPSGIYFQNTRARLFLWGLMGQPSLR